MQSLVEETTIDQNQLPKSCGKLLLAMVTEPKLFGYTREEAIGRHIGFIIPEGLLNEEMIIMDGIKQGRHIDHYETYRLRKNGSIIDVSLSISPIRDSSGNITGASKIAQDITEKKE